MNSDLIWLRRMLSHNVRMPMSVIAGYGELLRQGLLSAEEQKDAIDCICENILYMNDILKVVLGEEDDTDIHTPEAVDIAALAQRAMQFVQEVARKLPVGISVFTEKPCMRIHAERIAVLRIFYQLFENAFKYLESGDKIQIQVLSAGNDQVLVIFKDDGRGISEKEVKRVFQKGFRGENSKGKAGSGYGLYDVKQVMERYGGTVKVFSREQGGFSVFLLFSVYPDGLEEGEG